MHVTRSFITAAAFAALAACGGKMPSKPGMPDKPDVPNKPDVPGGLGGSSGEVDPNTCGNYAAVDAGAKLKIFLQATKDLQTQTVEMVKVVKQSCVMMGQELGIPEADLGGDDTKAICARVITTYKDNMKVAFKPAAKIKITYKPAECKVEASASASGGAACSGAAAADNSGGGGAASCKAAGHVNAALKAECKPAVFSIEADAKMEVDKTKAEMTLKAARNGFPKLFSATERVKPLQEAVTVWAKAASDLKDMGPKFVNSFKDQALCITGQLAASVSAATNIQANVSVSVEVSASASGSVGGG
jgi:hypothetical protein